MFFLWFDRICWVGLRLRLCDRDLLYCIMIFCIFLFGCIWKDINWFGVFYFFVVCGEKYCILLFYCLVWVVSWCFCLSLLSVFLSVFFDFFGILFIFFWGLFGFLMFCVMGCDVDVFGELYYFNVFILNFVVFLFV